MFKYRHSYSGDTAAASAGGSGIGSTAADFVSAAVHWASGVAHQAVNAIRVHMRERRAVRTLSSLDDRTLKDIGVYRSEIRHLAARFAYSNGVDYRTLKRGR